MKFLLFSFLSLPMYAGVVLFAPVPPVWDTILKQGQALIEEKLKEEQNLQHVFEPSLYVPHISLAYLSDEELTMDKLELQEKALDSELQEFAQTTRCIALDNLKHTKINAWKGSKPATYQEKNYNNYAILVAKMEPSEQLTKAVEKLDTLLLKHPAFLKRKFLPFAPHLTFGYLYAKDDSYPKAMVEKLTPLLQNLIDKAHTQAQPFAIDSFTLSTHDKKTKVYQFQK